MATPLDRTLPSAPYDAPARPGDPAASAQATAPAGAELPLAPGEHVVVTAIREEARVVTHAVESARVRVAKVVSEREEVVSAPIATEHVRVERVPVGRTVERMPEVRQEGDTTIVPVVEEVLVLERRILLKEEIRITRERAVVASPPQTVRLRSEHVRVDRVEPPKAVDG